MGTEPWTCTTYDGRGRPIKIEHPAYGGHPARTATMNYSADPDGTGPLGPNPFITTTTDPAGTISVTTDMAGGVVKYMDVFGNTTDFTYDQAGRETANTGPTGNITKAYDNADRLTALTRNGQTVANGFTYDNASRLTGVTYPSGAGNGGNGTSATFAFDTFGREAGVTWTGPGGTITSDAVTRRTGGDVNGQVVDGVDHHPGDDYTYDNAGRLTDAWVPGRHLTYGFAASGSCGALPTAGANTNRTSQAVEGGATTTYCYDRADRLTSTTDTAVGTIAYDAHGNTTSIFGETHTYDAADRHLSTTKAGTTVTYTRDATDRIVERKVGTTVTARYGSTGSGDAPEFTANAANAVQEITYALPGGALLTTRPTGNVWSYPNTHGDIVATATQAGVKQGATRVYDPYGNLVTGTVPDNSAGNFDYGWLGEQQRPIEHEPTLEPVIEMGARQYSPRLGRFLEVDPVEGGSANDYDYVAGDPVNAFDLDGTWGWSNIKRWGRDRARSVWRHRTGIAFGLAVVGTFGCAVCALAGYGATALWAADAGNSCYRRHAAGCIVGVGSLGLSGGGRRLMARGTRMIRWGGSRGFGMRTVGRVASRFGRGVYRTGRAAWRTSWALDTGSVYCSYARCRRRRR